MKEIVNNLNELLADLNVYYRKVQNYHWNVEGEDFFVMHAKLEEYYDELNTQIDEIAEHILILEGQPLGRLEDYLEKTSIQEAENRKIGSSVVYKGLICGYETLLEKISKIKKEADEKECYATSSLMDNYILDYKKKLWMLNQTIK